jgi:hypothetical protein
VVATSPSAGSVSLSWTAPSDGGSPITSYKVWRSTDQVTWTTVVSATASTSLTLATPGGTYYFRVQARNAVGGSAYAVSNQAPVAP